MVGGESQRNLCFSPFHGPVLPDSLLPASLAALLSLLPETLREPTTHYSQVPKPTAPGIAGYLPASKILHCFLRLSLENVGYISKLFKLDPLWTGMKKRTKRRSVPISS